MAALEKGVEHQSDPGLHLPVRGLGDDTGGVAHQPNRQWQGQLPRSALASRPAVRRLRIVCSSSSEIVPFSPSSSRPFGVPGS